ncbi:Cif family virulence factor [Acidithiobacillus ferrivorans]|uniref:hypothetical protein n=1 Tax=Acidithiobacillus ferrivorans TaxID=160808 RepID=UPI001E3ACED7|nr:hypothetical protein [Acidithiobacillus ferrivorans]
MIDKEFAEHFASDWIGSWNNHDLDRILSHYSEQFEMFSPPSFKLQVSHPALSRARTRLARTGRRHCNSFLIFSLNCFQF